MRKAGACAPRHGDIVKHRKQKLRQADLFCRIERNEIVSASRDWELLVSLATLGMIDARRAPNGQLEYLHLGVPIKVGP
jgi:hypothetical protein